MISSQECGNGGSEEEEEAVKQIQSLSAASAPSPPPFESCTFFLAGINPFRRVIHPSLRGRVPLIDLIEERSSFHEICTNRERRTIPKFGFPQRFSQNFCTAIQLRFCSIARWSILHSHRDVTYKGPRQTYTRVVNFPPTEFGSFPESGFSLANVLCVIWFRQNELFRGT